MSNTSSSWQVWRRTFKAALPYVRRREHRLLQSRLDSVVHSLAWSAPSATQAQLHALKPLAGGLAGELCFFVSFAANPVLKPHVHAHIEHLVRCGIQVVLVVNGDIPPEHMRIDARLLELVSAAFLRQNVGFDFAAWAHLYAVCGSTGPWQRLYLVNDSIVGPLDRADFDVMIERIRCSSADVVGLTEHIVPQPHLQSYFLAFNERSLRNPVVDRMFARMLSLPTKEQVIDAYETRLTLAMTCSGLRCEALFPSMASSPHDADDTSFRWAELIDSGFPYIKGRVLARLSPTDPALKRIPPELQRSES
jgi:lipopolysaccharide biosynthesis protein